MSRDEKNDAGAEPMPWWRMDPCPVWCTEPHGEDDLEDRVHGWASEDFPVVKAGRGPRRHEDGSGENDEYYVAVQRDAGQRETWVYIGGGDLMPRAVRRPLGDPGTLGRAWRLALGIAAAVATVVVCLYPLTNATYNARLEQDAARAPHAIGMASDYMGKSYPKQATGLYDISYENLSNYTHVEALWLENLKPGAAPPPGLSEWPGPREVIASPALLAADGGRQFAQRYGSVSGTIGGTGLVNPNEKILYVGIDPATHVTSQREEVVNGFGAERKTKVDASGAVTSSDDGYAGDVLYQWSRSAVWTTVTLFGLAPCLVLIGIAIRLGGERRDQYIAWLTVVGAEPKAIRRYLAREALLPVVLGSLSGLVVVGLAMMGNWSIPGFGAVIVGADLRSAWPWCFVCAVVVIALMLALLFATHRVRRRHGGATPRARTGRSRPWLILVLVALIAGQSYAYAFLYPTDPGAASTYSALTAAAVVVLLAPCGGAVLAFAGRLVLRLGRRIGSPGALVTARELGALPKPALRTSAVIAAAILVTVQAVILLAGPNQMETTASAELASDPMLAIPIGRTSPDDSWLPRAAAGLPDSVALVRVAYKDNNALEAPTAVRTSCDQIDRLGITCPTKDITLEQTLAEQPARARDALGRTLPLSTPVEVVPSLAEATGDVYAISTDGQQLDPIALSTESGKFASPTPQMSSQWTGFMTGAKISVANARWLLIAGGMAAAIFFISAVLALWFETVRVGRRLAALSMTMDRRRTSNGLGIGLIGVPVAAATVLGILAALGFAIAPTSVPGSEIGMPWGYFAVLAAAGLALSVAAGLLAARTIRDYGTRWVPSEDDA